MRDLSVYGNKAPRLIPGTSEIQELKALAELLGPEEAFVLLSIARWCRPRWTIDGWTVATYAQLAIAGLSREQMRRQVRRLEKRGLVTTERYRNGSNFSLRCRVHHFRVQSLLRAGAANGKGVVLTQLLGEKWVSRGSVEFDARPSNLHETPV
jgi:DNA-binding MarR family transcriptional regulator